MSQPKLRRETRSRLNAALTGCLGAKRALAGRLGVDTATTTRCFQPERLEGAQEPTAETVLEAFVFLAELGGVDVLEEELRGRGLTVRIVADPGPLGVGVAPAQVLHTAAAGALPFAQVIDQVRKAVADGRIDTSELRDIRQAASALKAQITLIERTAEAAAGQEST